MNSLHGHVRSAQQTNERNQSVALTIAQLEFSLAQLKQQVDGGVISRHDDGIATSPLEAKISNLVGDLPHTQLSAQTDRGHVGKMQVKNTTMSDKQRARATRKERKKQLRGKNRALLLPSC